MTENSRNLSFTIITPSYNQGRYLSSAIHSLRWQTGCNIQYSVLDGGSTDDSVDILRANEDFLFYWRSGPDDGPYAAVNEGLQSGTGDILGWLNSDDMYFPGALRFVHDVFAARPEVMWLTTRTLGNLNAYGDWSTIRIPGASSTGIARGHHIPGANRRFHGFIQQESTFFRRSLIDAAKEKYGFFGLDLSLNLAADFDLWLRFSQIAELYTTNNLIAAFRWHGANRSGHIDQYIKQAWVSLDRYGSVPKNTTLHHIAAKTLPGRVRLKLGIDSTYVCNTVKRGPGGTIETGRHVYF
ncbi:glycosyltransferase family 2 protein [Acuticoccus yangtzensis]|uniref:glycosyltransferase family 2 protein n=1 Tax=Acuticoccus yangtzensis TaxID=1443441 RepID=UPI000AE8A27E|nr:glycosyltransferase family 2 protein [Acuticoccus yangtzensis]